MTDAHEQDDEAFQITMSGGGTPRGHLQDPSAVTLHLDPRLLGDTARGKEMFALAIDQQHTALSDYATAIAAADGDVTAPAVQDAATALHQALHFLPIAHTAYTGVGFPTARVGDGVSSFAPCRPSSFASCRLLEAAGCGDTGSLGTSQGRGRLGTPARRRRGAG